MVGFLPFLSGVLGWIYFTLWSLSFYPQVILNYRRKSTTGTTVDFPFLNVLGFSCYFVSNLALYYSAGVRKQYLARNDNTLPTVQFNDIVFALHGLILSVIVVSQYLGGASLWRFPTYNPGARPSRFAVGLTAGALLGVAVTYIIVGAAAAPGRKIDPAVDWCDLDVVYAIGYVKLVVTLVKYSPQLLANFRNKSTEGWSIWTILLDLWGGFLSIGQQGIDSYLEHNWSGITGNPVKFGLGQISIFFDVLFMLQHYVIYRRRDKRETADRAGEAERLLPPGQERRLD